MIEEKYGYIISIIPDPNLITSKITNHSYVLDCFFKIDDLKKYISECNRIEVAKKDIIHKRTDLEIKKMYSYADNINKVFELIKIRKSVNNYSKVLVFYSDENLDRNFFETYITTVSIETLLKSETRY